MLSKLFKHEFKATYKMFALLYAALIALTLLTRFCIYIPFEGTVFKVIKVLLAIMYVVILVGMSLFSMVMVLRRFNTNMLKDQGYLSNTLPVKMWQQITAKTVTYTFWVCLSFIAMFGSLGIFFAGKGSGKAIKNFVENLRENTDLIPMLIIFIVLLIVQVAVNLLNFFASLSLGQIFAKHRIAGAVLFYFLLNYALGFLSSLLMIVAEPLIEKIDSASTELSGAASMAEILISVKGPVYAYLGVMFVAQILLAVIYFAITNIMLTKKLNLE